jgi:hypothetical protein
MHPTLARYLDLAAAADTLRREERGEALGAREQPFAVAARAFPEERALLLALRGPPSPEAQQALLVLAAHAAVVALREDERLGPALAAARAALAAEGATPAQVEQFLAERVLEEAFDGDPDPDTFDRAGFEETLRGVPALARLTRERVEGLIEAFTLAAAADWEPAHRLAARELVEAAWSEGPQPLNGEQLEQALERVREQLGEAHAARGVEAVRRFVDLLYEEALLGPLRRTRLHAVLDLAAAGAGFAGERGAAS